MNTQTRPWIDGARAPRRAGVNAFGFGGINAHAVLEEAPASPNSAPDLLPWESELLFLGAATREEFVAEVERLGAYVAACPDMGFADLAFTLSQRFDPPPIAWPSSPPPSTTWAQAGARPQAALRSGLPADQRPTRHLLLRAAAGRGREGRLPVPRRRVHRTSTCWRSSACTSRGARRLRRGRPCHPVAGPQRSHQRRYLPSAGPLEDERRRPNSGCGASTGNARRLWAPTAPCSRSWICSACADMMAGHSIGEWSSLTAAGIAEAEPPVEALQSLDAMVIAIDHDPTIPEATLLAVATNRAAAGHSSTASRTPTWRSITAPIRSCWRSAATRRRRVLARLRERGSPARIPLQPRLAYAAVQRIQRTGAPPLRGHRHQGLVGQSCHTTRVDFAGIDFVLICARGQGH